MRRETLQEISNSLLEMLWTIASDSCPGNTEDAAPWAIIIAEQIHGRKSWQYASALYHDALYGGLNGPTLCKKRKCFVSRARRAIQIYRGCNGVNVAYSGYDHACYELAQHLMKSTPRKNRAEVSRLLRDVIQFQERHGLQGLADDAAEILKAG